MQDNFNKAKVIVICGPTASGKTALSIEVAKKINGEIISCDSMQIYKDMNIGTAKPTKEEMGEIKHYLIDYVLPTERYSVAEYKKDAKKAIKEVIEKGKTPIIVGGTGLYVDSLIYEIEYPEIKFDEEYRKKLEKEVQNEPLIALDGGKDGLEFYRKIIKKGYKYLNPNGYIGLEIGYNQKRKVEEIIKNNNMYINTYCKKDLYDNDRIIITQLKD